MDRVLIQTPATISETWYQGDTIADPGTVTIHVTRDDGIDVVAPGTATAGTGAAARTFALTTTHTAQLDTLTATWTSATLGTLTTTIEVVGDFLFTIAEARPLVPGTVTNDQLARARTRVEQAIERRVGFSFVPRYSRSRTSGTRAGWRCKTATLRPYVRAIRWVTTAGTEISASDLANIRFDDTGITNFGYLTGSPVLVGYEHGLDSPDEEIRSAALDWARFSLTQDQSIDSRAERLITDDGTLVFGGGMTGLPSVDRVIDSYRLPVVA